MGHRRSLLVVGLWFASVGGGAAQEIDSMEDGPRFFAVAMAGTPPVDASDAPVLRRRVTVAIDRMPLGEALQQLGQQARVRLAVSPEMVPVDKRVSLHASSIMLGAALFELLSGLGLDVQLARDGRGAAIVRRGHLASSPRPVGRITGRVTKGQTTRSVDDAEVFLEGTRWRTTTDTGGRYLLEDVEAGSYRLTVRRLGFTKQTRGVTVAEEQTDTVDVAMDPVVTRLNELVTTATGRQRRLELGNDITTINADSVVRGEPIRNLTDLLEARVPGLVLQRTSGAPGDPARLRLRGASSPLLNNDPIVVVDGVRVYAQQSAARSANLAASQYAAPSPLDYIDPNSIEALEVIKGPSAATLYGQDAANGVIVITTKKGKAGPARWTASVDHGRTQMEGQYPELLVRWGHLVDNSTPVACPISNLSASAPMKGLDCRADSTVRYQLLSDPALTVLDRGRRTAATLGVSGGSLALTYALTGSYQDELGVVKLPAYEAERYQDRLAASPPDWMRRPQHLKQWGATSRITARLGSEAEVSLTTNFSRTAQQRSSLEGELGKLMSTFLDRSSGTYYRNYDGRSILAYNDALLNGYFERAIATAAQFTNGLNFNWRLSSWFTVTADAGLNVDQRADEVFIPRNASVSHDSIGALSTGWGTSVVSTVNLRGNALVPLGLGLQFRFAAGVNYTGTSIDDQALATRNLAAGTSLLGTEIMNVSRNEYDDATFGWYVEPSLGHRRFWLSTGLRLDGGSSYGSMSLPKFPKLSFSYLLSDESFFPFKDLFQTLRLRVAYGRAGRQPGPADRLRVYGATRQLWTHGQYNSGVFLQALGNTELRPEQSTEFEGGLDADLLDSRVTVTITGYRKTTDDALLSVPLPPSVYGGTSVYKNIGLIRNTGLDMTVAGQLFRSGPLTWGTQLSISQNRNLVVKLAPGVKPFYSGDETGGIRVVPGYPLFSRWSKPILGYADGNGDGVLQSEEIVVGDTAVYVGQTLPNYTANLHTTVALWHSAVSVTAGFLYEDGLSQSNGLFDQLAVFSRAWNDPSASLAEQVTLTSPGGTNDDYNNIQTVSTLRFNDVAVTYNVPVAFARRVGAETLSLSVQGVNLGLWTNYSGLDPNVNTISTGNGVFDGGVLPQSRTWQVRVNATY